jgi:hypothetical protein
VTADDDRYFDGFPFTIRESSREACENLVVSFGVAYDTIDIIHIGIGRRLGKFYESVKDVARVTEFGATIGSRDGKLAHHRR